MNPEKLSDLPPHLRAELHRAWQQEVKKRRERNPVDYFPWHEIQEWVLEAPGLFPNPVRVILIVGGNRSGKSKLAMGLLSDILDRNSPINDQLMATDKYTGKVRPMNDRDPVRAWVIPPTKEKYRQDWVMPADGMGIRYWLGDKFISHTSHPDDIFFSLPPGADEEEVWYRDPQGRKQLRHEMCDQVLGKCLAAGTPVLTPSGPKPIEDFKGGESVFDAEGSPVGVLRLHDNGTRDVYEAQLSSGGTLRLTDDHRVLASRRMSGRRVTEVVPFSEVRTRNSFGWLVSPPPLQFPERDLPLPPYYVGAMIGDGSIRTGDLRFTNIDQPVLNRVFRESGIEWERLGSRPTYRAKLGYHGPLRSPHIRSFGSLVDVPCGKKFVPDEYKYSSVEQRRALLAGLIDTDGGASGGGLEFCSKSRRLVEDVSWLTLSLGGRANKVREKVVNGVSYWRVQLYVEVPCELERKRITCVEDTRLRRIVDIRPAGNARVYDLEVDSDDHLFVAGDTPLVVHNSQDQKLHSFEASEIHVAIFDEEPQDSSKVTSTMMRIATSNGVLIFAFTPLMGLSWSYDRWWKPLVKNGRATKVASRRWLNVPEDRERGAEVICQMGMADNPRARVYAKEVAANPELTDAAKAARLYGEYGYVQGALISDLAGLDIQTPSPEHEKYVIDRLPGTSYTRSNIRHTVPGEIVKWYLLADPNKSYGATLAALDANGNLIFVSEHLEEEWPNRRHAEAFKKMEKKYRTTGNVERYADYGSAGRQSMTDLEDFGLHFDPVKKGAGSVSRSIKRLRGLAWVDPDHYHPITQEQGAPRVYFYRPGLISTWREGDVRIVGSKLCDQLSQARQKEDAPPDTPDKDSRNKLDLFDCARYTADLVVRKGPQRTSKDDASLPRPHNIPFDKKGAKIEGGKDGPVHPLDREIWLPEYF